MKEQIEKLIREYLEDKGYFVRQIWIDSDIPECEIKDIQTTFSLRYEKK